MSSLVRRHPLTSFFVLACGLSWLVAVPLMLSKRGVIGVHISENWEMLAAFGPFAAALIVTATQRGRPGVIGVFRSLGRWRVPPFWLLLTVFSPGLLWLVAMIFVLLQTGAMPNFESERALELATSAGLFELVIVSGLVQGLGEEPGWRGFAITRLRERYGPLASTVGLFPVWLLWHVPMFLARPEFGLFQWLGFSLGILSAAVWLTLIWDATRSLLMAVTWHALINIHRSVALAVSTPLFLAIGNAVLIGAIVIVIYWTMTRTDRRKTADEPLST